MEEERIETMISNLPSEILRQIVSLIPLKEAVRTSILSTSWKSLWTPFQVEFDFDPNQTTSDDDNDDEANKKVNQIMGLLLKSSSCPEIWKFSPPVGKREKALFFSAVKGGGKELHIDFSGGGKQIQRHFNLNLEPFHKIPEFSSIKTLHLISVNQIAKDIVSSLFSNCQTLESLKLEKCSGLQSINIKASNSLKNFEMLDCENIESIEVSATNLKSLRYRGVLPLIQINSCPNLTDVVLDLREGYALNEFDCEDVLNLLSSIKDVEILRISGWLLEWVCAAGVVFGRLEFKLNKLKELWWSDALVNQTKRDSLACFLNISPFLEKLFIQIDQNLSSIACPYFHQCWHEPHLWMDYETVKSNASQLQHLKIIQFEGFTNEDHQLLLLDLLLTKSVTLKSMTVISPDKQSKQVTKIPMSQLKQTSGCNLKRTVISSPNKDYFFGLFEGVNIFLGSRIE